MADNSNNNLANAIAGWQAASGATSTSLTEPARARVADILSYPDNFEARRQVQNDFSSYAREAGDLSTQLDSPQFEKAVANKYSGFQAGQTNKMTAAANLIADSETANEVANRKINNLTQQKELNDQKVGHIKNFMKATMNPLSPILGLFDDSYSMSKQMENLAYDESQLENLQTQDALDDQLVLQKAFGQAGYNPLANDVIEPANRWEKQYYDELTALQRNKISATSNKIAAKGGELEAYKAETARLKALSDILGDESRNARAVYEEAGKANERDRDYAQMEVDLYKQQAQTGRAILKSKDQQAQLVDNALQREVDMAIAELKRASAIDTLAGKQLTADTKMSEIAQQQKHDASQETIQASKEKIEAMRTSRSAAASKTSLQTAQLNLQGKQLDLQKEMLKSERAKAGQAGGATAADLKAPTAEQVTNVVSNGSQAISEASKLMAQAPVLLGLNGQLLGNNPAVQQAFNELGSDAKLLNQVNANGEVVTTLASDPEAYASYKAATKRVNDNSKFIASEADKVLGNGSAESKEVTSIRLASGGIVPQSQKGAASKLLVTTNERSSSGASIEGSIWNDGMQEAFSAALYEKWADLPSEIKGQIAKTTGIDPNDKKAAEKAVAAILANIAESGSVGGKSSKDSETFKRAQLLINPYAILDEVVNKGYSYTYQTGTDADGTPITKTVHTSGVDKYEEELSIDMAQFKAASLADNFNKKNNASINSDFSGVSEPEFELGKRLIDQGYDVGLALQAVDSFKHPSLTKAWAADYQQRSVANDNIAASLMPVLGFTNYVNGVIRADSGFGDNAETINAAYDKIKGKLQAYASQKAKLEAYNMAVMAAINSKKGN